MQCWALKITEGCGTGNLVRAIDCAGERGGMTSIEALSELESILRAELGEQFERLYGFSITSVASWSVFTGTKERFIGFVDARPVEIRGTQFFYSRAYDSFEELIAAYQTGGEMDLIKAALGIVEVPQ